MKKRVLSLFMVLVLCLTLLPTAAFAEGEDMSLSGGAIGGSETGGEGGGALAAPGGSSGEGGGVFVTPGSSTGEGGGVFVTPGSSTGEGGGVFVTPGGEAGEGGGVFAAPGGSGSEGGGAFAAPGGSGSEGGSVLAAPGGEAGEDGEGSGGTHYVAESGGTQYETVQKILGEMEEGEITLLDSVTEDLTVYAATTIHMNGHSITGNINATDSLTLNGGTVDGTVKVDGGTLNMTAPSDAAAAIDGGLNVVSGSAFVSGAKVGVKGTLYFDGTDMLISGAVKAVELDSAAEPAAKTLYGSATVNGDTAAEAGFDTDTYKVGGEIAKKLTNKQVGSTTPAAPSLTLTETSKSLTAGKTAVFTANYTGTDTLNAYVQGSAVNGYFTISQKNNGDGTYTVSVKIDEETPGGTYTLFVHEVGNTSVQASATITVIGLPDAAEVSGKQYKSLPRALNAAQDGDTVKLLANHVTDVAALNALGDDFSFEQYASIVPVVTKTLTLDLNHKTVDYLEVGFSETNQATQKKEILATGNLTVTGEAAYGRISNLMFMAGALDIRSGEIGGSGCTGLVCDANSGSVTVSNGTVYGLSVMEGASVTVNGGSNHAGEWVVASGATLKITDGTFGEVKFTHNGTIAISGGTFKSIKSYIAEELQPLMSLLDTQKAYAFYKGDDVQDGNATELTDVTVKEHIHTMVNNKCACGFSCTHKDTDGTSTIDKDGKCTVCGMQFAAGIGETYYTDVKSALDAAADGQTVKLLANKMLPDGIYVSKTLTLDLNGHSLSGYSLNVGGLTATSQVRTGNLTVIDSSGGNGAVGVTVRDGGTLVFHPENDNTTLLQLEVWGGTVGLYGGKILRNGLRLNNSITLGNLLPGQAGLAYYNGDTQLTLEEAASQTCDLVVKLCSHGGKNGFDKSATTCPYCGAPAVAETALNNGEGNRPWRRFADLQTALDADRDGGSEFKLLADVTGDYTIDGTKDTGLDLNGHCIKGTVTVKGIKGDFITTTLSNTQNTTIASIYKVIAFAGAELGGSKYPAVIGELTLAEGATWKTILNDTALGYKVLNADGTHKWYARDDVNGSQLNNVIINRLPITSKTLNLKVNGKNLTGNSPKVERGTIVQLCASCNAKGADVSIYIGESNGNNNPIYSYSKQPAEYKKIGTSWYYVVDLNARTIGNYDIYFTATKDGYSVMSGHKKLIVTKPNLSNAQITFPDGNEAAFNYVTATGVPNFIVTYKGQTLKKDVDFIITGGGSTYDVGPCTLTIQATDSGDYTGSKSAQWTVRPLKVAVSVGDIIKTYDATTDLPASAKFTFKSADSYYAGPPLPLAKGADYEVLNAHYDSADASETEKTVSFTIQLKNPGYVFEDGTTEKAFTLKGSETDKTFKINQASVKSPGEITLYVYNDAAKTYTINLASLRPQLTLPCEYGTTQYQGCNYNFTDGAYLVGTDAISVSKEGILTLRTVAVHSSDVNQQIGTITVPVVTTNYQKFEFTINVVIGEKIRLDQSGVTVTATDITYGQTLADSTLTATGSMICPRTKEVIPGTFAWTNPSTKPDASESYQAEWTFTPNEGYEEYAPATGKVTVKVNKAAPTFTAPTAQENLTYTGREQALIIAGMTDCGTMEYSLTENGTYSQDIPVGTDAGAYTVWYRVMGDANHNDTAPASVAVRIGKKPLTITWVTAASKHYDGTTDADITGVTFDGVNLNRGTDYTVTANFDDAGVGSGKNVTATVTLMGQAAKNYALEQSSVPTTGSITKAAAPDFTKETALTIVNGHEKTYTVTLPALPTLETPKAYGALTYEIGEIKLNDGYYTSGAKVENGELTLPIQKNDVETTGSVGTATVVVKSTNYEDIPLTVNVSAKNRPTPVLSGALTLTPARITYGDPLSKIKITGTMKVGDRVVEGTFSWQQPGDTVLDASDLGHVMEWRFTPEDENAYSEATGSAMVKVDKATQYGKLSMTGYAYGGMPSTPTLTDRTGDPNAQVRYTYSTTDSGLVQTWDIQNPPALNAGTYRMFARIGQTSNYYEYDVGYCEFVVAKATPTYTKPTGLTAKYGQTLADVTLPDGWSWMDSSESVGDASNAPKTFQAKFTPTDTENYNTVENIALEVAVSKADQAALTVQGADSVVYGQTLTLTATGGTGTGAVTYRMDTAHSTGEATIDPNTGVLTPVKVGSVSVIATKAGNKDYNDVTSAAFVLMIKPATPTGEPKYTQITASDKTLKDAALTIEGSTLKPHDGKLEWVDEEGNVLPDSTWVEINTAYQWRFTPADTNYTTLTGKITLYRFYTIEATAETGGRISPSGNVGLCGGEDQTFTITPNKGYAISNVRVDGKSIGAVKSYTFENVSRDHTILAIFMKANGNPQTGVFVEEATGRYYEDTVD